MALVNRYNIPIIRTACQYRLCPTPNCSRCGHKVAKGLADRWHCCPHGGLKLGDDHNSAINIKHGAVGCLVLRAKEMSCAMARVPDRKVWRKP